ncbi:hypothetical protein F7725_013264 [Dissostichus mawsoni]|uniref:Uncharacterized protein n=1 Tax=Dissostichus mawsoni TaxID=36200 RepID=A0A7J5YPL2_DISMA|nr:hypothetical protein F7725_013264 [Dissostichus mawsoni]
MQRAPQSVPSLGGHPGASLRLALQKASFLGSSSGDSSPGLSEDIFTSLSSTGSIPDLNARRTPSLKTEREQASCQ